MAASPSPIAISPGQDDAVELDTLPPQAVIDRLKGLAVAGNPGSEAPAR
jgi:hypothetical protein